jgi:uncharacterized protein (DUF169 family)
METIINPNVLMLKKLNTALELKRQVVGVKFLYDNESFDLAIGKQPYNKMPYCVMVKTAMADTKLKVTIDNFSCKGSRNVLGLTEPLDSFITGESGKQLGLYYDIDTSKNAAAKLTRVEKRAYGIQNMPLKDFSDEPDVVIIISSPYNIMRILQGNGYYNGVAKSCSVSGNQALCSELTAEPFVNGEINFSLLCSGTRFWCGWAKDEMGIGMPYKYFDEIVSGVLSTLNPTELLSDKLRIKEKFEVNNIEFPVDTDKSYYYKYNKEDK